MRILSGFFVALIFTAAASAQFRGFTPQPVVTGTFGNVVFPAGTSALPGVTRTFPNAVSPAGTAPRLVVPFSSNDPTRLMGNSFGNRGFGNGPRGGRSTIIGVPYAGPVYFGGYPYGYGYGYDPSVAPAAAPQQQPNVIVVYPPAPQPVAVVPPEGQFAAAPSADQTAATQPAAEASHYLIAFKDHTIYSAVAYWVEGDTLHYFTSGSTHNQVSLSLIDKDLTERLNKEIGVSMDLPK